VGEKRTQGREIKGNESVGEREMVERERKNQLEDQWATGRVRREGGSEGKQWDC